MGDLEHWLLEAAGRTGTSGRKKLSRSQVRRQRSSSYSDEGSDSKDDDSEDENTNSKSRPQMPVKKRIDPPEKDGRNNQVDDGSDDDRHGSYDSDSELSVGSDLYKDDEDREKLSKMSELEREMILADRSTRRDDYWLKKKAKESSKSDKMERKETPPPPSRFGRSLVNTEKTAAKNALNELRAKRLKQQDAEGIRRSRDSSGLVGGASAARDSSPAKRKRLPVAPTSDDSSSSESEDKRPARNQRSTRDTSMADSDEDGSISGEHVAYEDIKAITIRRSKLAKWFMEPFFEDLIAGCFVRVGIGVTRSGQRIYRLCMVKNVDATDPDRTYKLENKTTHKYLNCIWGNEASAARWQMARISDAPPLEEEFKALLREVERTNGQMPMQEDVLEKIEEIQKINKFVYSAATVKQMLQEKKSASIRPLNIAAEKNRLKKEMEIAEIRGDEAELERVRKRLTELEAMSREVKKDDKAARLAEMNRKNRVENFKNASELKPVNTSLKAGEAGYDPFSRRWTRSSNYYVSKSKNAAANGDTEDKGKADGPAEAGEKATAAALEAAAGAGKLVDTNAPVDQGTESYMLHDFELPISLAALHKFGGPQGAYAGFMARKQRIEAAIGVKVPENDGRRHALTLTVSDYKRRRGLL